MLPPAQTHTYQPRLQQLALPTPPLQLNQFIPGASNVRSMPYQPQNVPLPPPILGPQPTPPRIMPMNHLFQPSSKNFGMSSQDFALKENIVLQTLIEYS